MIQTARGRKSFSREMRLRFEGFLSSREQKHRHRGRFWESSPFAKIGIDMRVVINKDNKILFLCGRFAMKTKKNVFAGGKCLHAMGTVRRWCVKRPFSQHFKPWHKLAWTDYYCRKLWHHRRTNLSPHQATCSTLSIRRFASLNNFPIKNRIKK